MFVWWYVGRPDTVGDPAVWQGGAGGGVGDTVRLPGSPPLAGGGHLGWSQ